MITLYIVDRFQLLIYSMYTGKESLGRLLSDQGTHIAWEKQDNTEISYTIISISMIEDLKKKICLNFSMILYVFIGYPWLSNFLYNAFLKSLIPM